MKVPRRGPRRRLLLALALAAGLAALVPAAVGAWGLLSYLRLERTIARALDQYYSNLTRPDREEYVLESEEVFDVPYMASTLAVEAAATRILDRHGRLMGEFASERALFVRDPSELPELLKKALVATEDGGFYEHRGIDWRSLARAAWVNARGLRVRQGGSTLTQQLAKVLLTTRRRTFGRKAFEALCARKIEAKFTKDQILLMYLNFVYFGHGTFGVEAASRYFFGKPARALELAESALLAGVIANPSRYSPFEHPDLARARHRTVLARMARKGFIAESAAPRYHEEFWAAFASRRPPETSFWRMTVNEAPYASELVRRRLEAEFTKPRILKGGLRVHTTFDLDLQRAAQEALGSALRAEAARTAASTGAARIPLEGALAALDPSDGGILAVVGGRGFNFSNQLIRAADSARPVGSAVKPFVFAAALEAGRASPQDKAVDAPVEFRLPGGGRWKPRNYGDRYYGEVTLREALAKSLNSVAVRLLDSLEIDRVRRMLAEATGRPVRHFPRELALALGTFDLSAVELAAAFAAFPNGGWSVQPHFIRAVEDREGRILHGRETPPIPWRVVSEETARTMVSMLQEPLKPGGTAHGAAVRTGFNLPAAGKTGTTNESRDAWFAGFTPGLSAAVWIGHDDMRFPLEPRQTGGNLAAPIWMEFVKAAYRDRPAPEFQEIPDSRREPPR